MKPNYQFEKRQRELEKKKKKAEKAAEKKGLLPKPLLMPLRPLRQTLQII